MRKLLLVALLLVGITGCAALFGEMVPLKDEAGNPVLNPDGTPAMVYREGGLSKLAKVIKPVSDMVPFGNAGLAMLNIITAAGVAVQTVRHKKKIEPDDMRELIDYLGPRLKEIKSDEDLGDLVAGWKPDSDAGKKLKRAFEKNRRYIAPAVFTRGPLRRRKERGETG